MDTARGRDDARYEDSGSEEDRGGGVGEPMFAIGTDERRMHVRAYNHWVSLLGDRPYPAIADLDPTSIADFGPNSVLLDFTDGVENPAVRFIGRTLREECAVDASIERIAEVPSRSLLSRLTDHYLQIIANRAPIGFEAEFTGTRGNTMMYRGILMPFSSDGESIDFIYGVISWKEMVSPAQQASLDAELARALRTDALPATSAGWADGPAAGAEVPPARDTLADKLARAREGAAAARTADTRSHAALYRALGRAHDFALASQEEPATLAALLADAGIAAQKRAPLTAVAKLVFGADYDKTRLTEFAAVLAHAREVGVAAGGLVAMLEAHAGGIKGVVAAIRAARRPATVTREAAPLAARPALARLELATGVAVGEAVVLVGRVAVDGRVEVVAALADARLAARALARA